MHMQADRLAFESDPSPVQLQMIESADIASAFQRYKRSRLPVRDQYRLPRTRRHRCVRPAIRLMTLGVNIAAIYRLETLAALVLNDHGYDKLTGWSNVIPVVPVQRRRDEKYKLLKEESHGTRSTPHRHRT
jgi:hypothetical protein